MTTRESWDLTPREIEARRRVFDHYLRNQAQLHADNLNATLRPEVAFSAADVMGSGDRNRRVIEHERGKALVNRANAQLALMKPGKVYDDLPDWAVKKW